jgi:PPOX class probable F420-dependent enzyme
MTDALLAADQRVLVEAARTGTLATRRPDGRPRLVPVCFWLAPGLDDRGRPRLYSPLDEKPKRVVDPYGLGRARDLLVLPEAALLVERWEEDWSRLAWVRFEGRATLLEPEPHERNEHEAAVAGLRGKYPQYEDHALDRRPIIRIVADRVVGWAAADDPL